MELFGALFGLLDLLIPPKDERGKRWHRIGCFVTLSFALLFAIIGSVIWLRGSL